MPEDFVTVVRELINNLVNAFKEFIAKIRGLNDEEGEEAAE